MHAIFSPFSFMVASVLSVTGGRVESRSCRWVYMTTALDAGDAATYLELDKDFHQCIIDRCGNHYLSRAYAVVAFRIQALRYRLAMDPALNAGSLQQHHSLARLIGEDKGKSVVTLMRKHIAKTNEDYQNTLDLGLPHQLC